jgi:hypothetical protein
VNFVRSTPLTRGGAPANKKSPAQDLKGETQVENEPSKTVIGSTRKRKSVIPKDTDSDEGPQEDVSSVTAKANAKPARKILAEDDAMIDAVKTFIQLAIEPEKDDTMRGRRETRDPLKIYGFEA